MSNNEFKSSSFRMTIKSIFIIFCSIFVIQNISAQDITFEQETNNSTIEDLPDPKMALLRSFVIPGWGHQYVDSDNWARGKIHLASDIVLIAGYFGLSVRADRFENTLLTQAQSKAGISLSNKSREFELAVANYNNLAEYNDFQLRSRRWTNVIEDTPENRWNWESEQDRLEFQDTRDKISNSENQLPTILTLMVANRILSGINAFTRARDMRANLPEAGLSYLNEFGEPGVTAHLRFRF